MKNLKLKNVTLVAVSSIKIEETIKALKKSQKNIDFFDVLLISHEKPNGLPSNISFGLCNQIKSINEYNKFMLYKLTKYIKSEFALVVQYDGYVLNFDKWDNSFLNYDYIGAPWRKNYYFTKNGFNVRVGNGGFSLRSKKLLDSFNYLNIYFKDDDISNYHEDGVICLYCRDILEKHGVRFAPLKIASAFSCEEKFTDSRINSFGFHLDKKNFKDRIKIIIRLILNFFHIRIFKYSDEKVFFNLNKL